ncbi:MAG: sigma 54-interacting transcriptional regulator [Clostridiales Family XIII bacterium]|nr:sigma 54-interacting transcriptional regulator [Clostridia bacterium]MDY3010457.1 sigma 54-interacting transcriptional regulator [Clostridiales Family XIII bacterium]
MKDMGTKLVDRIQEFTEILDRVGFNYEFDLENPSGEEGVLEIVDELVRISSRLVNVFFYSPDSICLADADGKMLAVNKAFEHTVGAAAEEVVGRNVSELEAQGIFRPSVLRLVKEENRPISVLQIGKHGEYIIVTGVPITDKDGKPEMLLSNARRAEDIEGLYAYVDKKKKKGKEEIQAFSDDVIMESEPMKRIKIVAEQIKDTDATILITGPSGVGKGVLAKYIHNISRRSKRPMVEINCGAIPENLLESELFGYAAGAFTGASANGKEGLIESADGGTLLLDEIGELPLLLQVKLLKVIQDKQIMRIGSMVPKEVNVRIIAATNRDLMALVKEGAFRADLFYRLNVIPIEIPPLKDREEDIDAAVAYFIKKFSWKYNRSVECTKEFMHAVMNYEWPGNMRELENYIERAVLTSKDGVLHMDGQAAMDFEAIDYDQLLNSNKNDKFHELQSYLEVVEGKVIKELYEKYRSSYKVAAELGVSQSKAYRLIKKYCCK